MSTTTRQNSYFKNAPNPKSQRSNQSTNDDEVTELEHLRKIFVGGITANTDEDMLKDFYSKFGTVIDVVVMRDTATKRSRGFGFVTFTKAHMVDAAQESRPHVIDGKNVDAKRVLPRSEREKRDPSTNVKKIFVGGLKNNHDEECLKEYFSEFGNVVGVKILSDKTTGRRRGFAFVEFDDYDSVDKVILKQNHSVKFVLLDVKKAVVTKGNDSKVKGGNLNNGHQNGPSGNNSYQQQSQQPQQPPMMNNGQPMNYYNGPPMNYNGPPMNYNGPPMNYNNWGPPPQNYGYNQGPPQNWNNWYYPPGNGWNGPQQPSWNQGWGNNGPMPNGPPMQQNAMGPQQGPMGPQQGPMGPQQGAMNGQQQGSLGGSQPGNMGGVQQDNMGGGTQQGNMGGPLQGNMNGQQQGNMGGPQQGNMGGPLQGNMGGSQQGPIGSQQGLQSQQSGGNPSHSQGSHNSRQNASSQEIWSSGTPGQNNFGSGYQQNYGGGPKKNNDLSSNRMNPYNGQPNSYGNQQQGYNNGYNNSGPGQNMMSSRPMGGLY